MPEKTCPDCGNPLRSVFMDSAAYLEATGKTPHWAELPCEICERNRVIAEIEEHATACEKARLGSLLENSMLKRRFVEKTFENFLLYGAHRERQENVFSYARKFADDFARHRKAGTWLLFVGNTGTGKGHLCAAVINRIVRSGYSALFTKTPRLLREIKDTFNRDSEVTQSEILRRMGELDLLVIDEVGVQFGTDTERMILYEVLDLRYEAMLPVILTSNIRNMKTMEKLLGERIIDRLFEGESRILFFDWESYRRFQQPLTETGTPSIRPLMKDNGADDRRGESAGTVREANNAAIKPFVKTPGVHGPSHTDGERK
ncbi:MAG: hypothetical protein AUK26_11495 [Syntrophaceae bacterium CG2_30_58_14]|nr:MAG: hypothetical protein AUK26_11495 [Syntrophaceae bacterium CG2_30_58_14]